mmetsp:Transcript_32408/g.44950  ORF Transcript_32408/g.44950 Transcript_32408/m.44950 type:complete len:229 (+) Transcript_32408:44-730(+)|eukprot:CAMPEP_0196591014 /NCGR_PEP_ID=MMETSP1081-20130531/68250_1 /TAXON_ID=36882 /ORGANISM="Pyramimonas amylifera, Strain CCMP720" /LENGTH=228 /DNA_ID=CAMNT_0041914265 /DNA_START=32 /DNA_END=718 /DNA_ORIENTATION=+
MGENIPKREAFESSPDAEIFSRLDATYAQVILEENQMETPEQTAVFEEVKVELEAEIEETELVLARLQADQNLTESELYSMRDSFAAELKELKAETFRFEQLCELERLKGFLEVETSSAGIEGEKWEKEGAFFPDEQGVEVEEGWSGEQGTMGEGVAAKQSKNEAPEGLGFGGDEESNDKMMVELDAEMGALEIQLQQARAMRADMESMKNALQHEIAEFLDAEVGPN